MLREHVLSTYRREFAVFLAEREFKILEEVGAVAERYEEAHARTSTAKRKERASYLEPGQSNGSVSNDKEHNQPVNRTTRNITSL